MKSLLVLTKNQKKKHEKQGFKDHVNVKCQSNVVNRKGFTLIKLIIAIALFAVLIVIVIPNIFRSIERSRVSEDQAYIRTLNSATSLMRITSSNEDIFMDETKSSDDLIEALLAGEFLLEAKQPQTKDAIFSWRFNEETWSLVFEDSFYVVTLSDGISIVTEPSDSSVGRMKGSYKGSAREIIIPSSINEISILEIHQDVFRNKGLVFVEFENGSNLERIHARAFEGNYLLSIDLPDTLERIDLWAFKDNNLTDISLPPNIDMIEQKAFAGNDLTKITIGSRVNTIQDKALGEHTDKFKVAYATGNAGTYVWDGENWIRSKD